MKARIVSLTFCLLLLAGTAVGAQQDTDRRSLIERIRARRQLRPEEPTRGRGLPKGIELPVPEEEAAKEKKPRKPVEPQAVVPLDRVIDRTVYRLGPGDVLALNLWGDTFEEFELVVTPEGKLIVPALAPLLVSDVTLAEAERRLIEAARGTYRGGQLTISLVGLRSFIVHVTGMVEEPGSYVATPADRVSDVIALAGGLAEGASSRLIRLARPDSSGVSVDLDMFLAAGYAGLNPWVDMGDVVQVPTIGDSVAIWGAVGTPGYYEYRPDDTVPRLIMLAGGLKEGARLAEAEWTRFSSDTGVAVTQIVNLGDVLAADREAAVRPGDRLFIPFQPEWRVRESVTIEGEVNLPGVYSITEGRTRLSDIIRRGGGLTLHACLRTSRVVRAGLQELLDPEFERLYEMNRVEMTDTEYGYRKARWREIRGMMSVDLERALKAPGSPDDVLLADGDIIEIARRRTTIEVAGQVNRPGLVAHRPGSTVKFYLEQAGGFARNARRGEVRVIKAQTGLWLTPTRDTVLDPGDTIFVPERVPMERWDMLKDVVLMGSQVATTVLVILTLGRR